MAMTIEERRAKQREYQRERRKRPGVLAYMRDYARNKRKDPEYLLKQRECQRERRKRPEVLAKIHSYMREYNSKRKHNADVKAYHAKYRLEYYRKLMEDQAAYAISLARKREYMRELRNSADFKAKSLDYQRKFGGSHYRKAKKRGNVAVRFSRKSIFERDKYKCAYCNKKLNIKTAVLEHKIPISRGGSHTPANCTTSCAKCNLEKHAKLIPGMQITIFDNVELNLKP